ncbi:hypothetical protein ACRRTK_009859 [Alexandromys fortis]
MDAEKQSIFNCCSPGQKTPVSTDSNELQDVSITLHTVFRPLASQLMWISTSIRGSDEQHRRPSSQRSSSQ